MDKEFNTELARKIASVPFWRPEYFPEYFTDSFTMDFPSAPPGMPSHFDEWEAERCFEWLNRTVKKWDVLLEEFHLTPNPEQFWAVGTCEGDVFWGGRDGCYKSKFFMRLEVSDGKINYIKGMIEPIGMLEAAGLEVPLIHKGLEHPGVDEFIRMHPAKEKAVKAAADLDMSPEAIELRRMYNLETNRCGVKREEYRKMETINPEHFDGGAWFVPDDRPWETPPTRAMLALNHDAPPELRSRVHAWIKASSPWMYRDTRGIIFPTDDKNVFLRK